MSAVKSPEELRARDIGKQDEIVAEKAETEELLPGWRKEVKIRKTGSAKKIDRFYTDPVTGYTFRSLKDVQRYLKTGEVGRLAIKPKDNSCVDMDVEDEKLHVARKQSLVEMKSYENFIESTSTEDGTCVSENASGPCEKIVEVSVVNRPTAMGQEEREEKRESKEQRMVPSPLSGASRHKRPLEYGSEGYRTRSKSSETSKSELHQRASKRLAGINIDAPLPSPPEPKTRQATRLAGIKTDVSPPSLPEPKTRQSARIAGIKIDASPPSQPEPKTPQASRQAGIKVDASVPSPPEPKTREARRLAGKEIGASPPSLPEPKTRQATRLAGIRTDAPPSSLPEPKTRQATRLVGIRTDSPPPSLPEPRTSRQATVRRAREAETRSTVKLATPKENDKIAGVDKSTSREMQVECVGKITDKHDGNADMESKPNCKQEVSIPLPPANQESREKINKDDEKQKFIFSPPATPKKHYKEIEMGPTASLPKEQAPATIIPPVNLGIQVDDKHSGKQELAVNPSVSNPIPQDGHGSMGFSLNDLWTDPCIEFAVKTLTGAIPFGDLSKADHFPATPLEVPLEELWTDPCIEFAVKTLTGAIPVGEEPCVHGYLQHQPSSCSETQAVPGFSLPDVGMSFCQTEVLSKHFETAHNKQQDSVVGNGVLQKSGNIVVPQGSNGQCSRPRFSE